MIVSAGIAACPGTSVFRKPRYWLPGLSITRRNTEPGGYVRPPDEASIARHDKKSPQADFGDVNHAVGGTCWRTKAKRFSNLL
jgi:hypothetical protein